MHLIINGDPVETPDGLTIRQLLEHLGLIGGLVAVELNQKVVPRGEHEAVALAEGDVLEIVHFVGGG
jgi:sulfur carrier protein